MIKNGIIASLMMYEFARVPGWAVEGIKKNLLCAFFVIVLTLLLTDIENRIRRIAKDWLS